jgi:hypothetical protein
MTKRTTKITTALSLALIVFAGVNCFAAAPTVPFNGVGSSAMFNLAALATDSATGCGTNIWTQTNGASGIDSRNPNIPAEVGNVWIVWNNAVTTVCAYLSVDSVVGNELFFAQPVATLSIPSTEVGLAGNDLVPTLTDVPLPQAVYNVLNNKAFNAAMTDIRSEDALFAVNRALAPYTGDSHCTGLGYTGNGLIGTPILSSQSTKEVTPVAFALSGGDPFNGTPVPAWTSIAIGAEPSVVFVNTTDTSSGGFGSANFNNVDRFVLSDVLNGTLSRTRDIANVPGLPSVPAHVFLREPTSGTYNATEFTIPESVEVGSCQELNVNPATDNPLNITNAVTGGTRQRVIGTGEMTKTVGATTDSIGYAFWSTGNFAKILTTTKYLSVDGVDPLNYSWYQSRGAFPNCVAPCPGLIPFVNILNGSYPAWTILRVSCYTPCPVGVTSLVGAAQTHASTVPDLVSAKSLQVFRSHFDRPQQLNPTSNGNAGEPPEAGGDEGGAVFTKNADVDNFNDTGLQLIEIRQ